MNTSRLLIGLLLLMLVNACYKDKGNYDYKDVNNFEVTVTPAPVNTETNIYLVNQPGLIADTFRLVAEGKQTLNSSEDNLEYTWYRTLSVEKKEISSDTIYGKENLMELPATKKSEWKILLVVRDKSMDLEYYKSMTVKTKVPFYNSWLFVHGADGNRKLGALSWDEAGKAEIVPDIMEAMGQPRYPKMTNIVYTYCGALDMLETERLFIVSAPDSITYVYPFNCKIMGRFHEMGINQKINKLITTKEGHNGAAGLINSNGKLFYTTQNQYANKGIPQFNITSGNVASDYKIDLTFVDADGTATMWDNTKKRLMYFHNEQLGYMGTLNANDLLNKKALWLGRDAKTVDAQREPCLFIAKNEKNNKCYLYHISYDSKEDKMLKGDDEDEGKEEYAYGTVTCDSTHNWGFTENTLFATSEYFQDQIFFTESNSVYLGVLASGEKIKLHEARGLIKKIAFRYTNQTSEQRYRVNLRILSMLVTNADGTDEIHEIHLSNGGDVEAEHVYDLGDVQQVIDWSFTAVNRPMDV